MAATDQKYRNQKTLDYVFAASCILMLLATLWMLVQDFNREYKDVQRQFRDVETALNERQMLGEMPDPQKVNELLELVKQKRKARDAQRDQLADEKRTLDAQRERDDNEYRSIKADYDSRGSYRDMEVEEAGKATGAARERLVDNVAVMGKELNTLKKKLDAAQARLDEIDRKIKTRISDKMAGPERELGEAEDELKKVTRDFDRLAKATAQRTWKASDSIRSLPILDAFESPTKIRQVWLPDLTIDYGGFRDVPRFDRCTSCHLAIDRASFTKDTLAALGDPKKAKEVDSKLKQARDLLERRKKSGEDLGFDVSDLPARAREVKLTSGQITQFCAHPRLDLFVDADSPHPIEKFGCTSCHAGQGSATEFLLAAHTPGSFDQEEKWDEKYHWKPSHYWDFPMLSSRFVESSCLKCHHQVTDLIRHGSQEEAPKLLKGYNLIRENGCFGCHEISGIKAGRKIGPDMRLEPVPALDYLTPSEQERAKADPLNPPGTLRKVGPGLRRLAEKTNEAWTRKWLFSPRTFREDTKMPHFYNLSNNNEAALRGTDPDQQHFPAAEIASITHYLFAESQAFLKGKDFYREGLEKTLAKLHAELKKGTLSDRHKKELIDVTRRLADVGIQSRPEQASAINTAYADLKKKHERIFELLFSEKNLNDRINRLAAREEEIKDKGDDASEAEKKALADLTAARVELKRLQADLAKDRELLPSLEATLVGLGKPMPLAVRLVLGDGTVASPEDVKKYVTDADTKDLKARQEHGRILFTERGCLACHAHDATVKAAPGIPAVDSHANFGPNLSRLAAKIAASPEGRRWLVQWVLNPNVYHPRTRMPVTHLSIPDAADVAEWLLAQPATDWTEKDPGTPFTKSFVSLARVYLAKAPTMTKQDVEKFLPEGAEATLGIPKERLEYLEKQGLISADADEQKLAAPVSPENLKWYIGKKSINRLGCYGCHDVSGFETSKPIGTALNDWGKKDAERLAFEDSSNFVASHFNLVGMRQTKADIEDRIKALQLKGGQGFASDDERNDLRRLLAGADSEEDQARLKELVTQAEKNLGPDDAKELKHLKDVMKAQDRIAKLEAKPEKDRTAKEKAELEKLEKESLWGPRGGKEPYERYFYEMLGEHHSREGFLHLKLEDPRSFDYRRRRTWDDRLRMPHFQFSRGRKFAPPKKKDDEDDDAYKARVEGAKQSYEIVQSKAEAEAREAVMTFVLGLVAEPVPLKYVNFAKPDRLAEVQGRQVLDKFNCAGCHLVRPGVYEFKTSPEGLQAMEKAFNDAAADFSKDFHFGNHNAWAGTLSPWPDRTRAYGSNPLYQTPEDDPNLTQDALYIRLAEALRFAGADGIVRDIPAASRLKLNPKEVLQRFDPYGGTFTELLAASYLPRRYSAVVKSADDARSKLPPPLAREGERVQGKWLYPWLLNPTPVRPTDYIVLRMPKFNMSPEDSQTLVNYFGATAKTSNPAAGLTYPYLSIPQRDEKFWHDRSEEYGQRLGKDKVEAQAKKMEPAWEAQLAAELAEANAAVQAAKQALANAKTDEEKKDRQTTVANAEARAKAAQEKARKNDLSDMRRRFVEQEVYAYDAYRLLTDRQLCLKCHNVGTLRADGAQGPPLNLAAERIRPEWMLHWIASPNRMFTYQPIMPQNFPKDKPEQYNELFQGGKDDAALDKVKAVRDVLMDLPRLADLPGNRPVPVPAAAGGGK